MTRIELSFRMAVILGIHHVGEHEYGVKINSNQKCQMILKFFNDCKIFYKKVQIFCLDGHLKRYMS